MTNDRQYDLPARYTICVQGLLDPSWSDWFDGFSIDCQNDKTVLVGTVIDQAALYGILAKINDLGLSLISVTKLAKVE